MSTGFVPRSKGGPDLRGNSKDRKRRKEWMLTEFGDGTSAPCAFCGGSLTYETITADRHPIPGCKGGRYIRGNIRPACSDCNSEDGGRLGAAIKAHAEACAGF